MFAPALQRLGNDKLKMGLKVNNKHVLRDALEFYARGIAVKCSDPKLNSILYSNRAQAHSVLGNWRKVLQDSVEAKTIDPSNVKVCMLVRQASRC